MFDELDNLTTVGTNSRRGGNQNFDLYHDKDSNKFIVSDAFYATHDMNNNGLTAHVGNGNVYLSTQPNDDSVSYKGREGFDKGVEFKSTNMSEVMIKAGLTGNLYLEEVGTKEGCTYFKVSGVTSEPEEAIESETINEEEVTA